MASRIIKPLPMFGLTALAIGAPITHPGVAEIRARTHVDKVDGIIHRSDTSTLGDARAFVRLRLNAPARRMPVTVSRRSNTFGQQDERPKIAVSLETRIPREDHVAASLLPKFDTVTQLGRPSLSERALQTSAIQVEPAEYAASSVTRTLNRATPPASAGALNMPILIKSDPGIYGTSASNAYKVYFPKDGTSDVGRSSESAQQDSAPPVPIHVCCRNKGLICSSVMNRHKPLRRRKLRNLQRQRCRSSRWISATIYSRAQFRMIRLASKLVPQRRASKDWEYAKWRQV